MAKQQPRNGPCRIQQPATAYSTEQPLCSVAVEARKKGVGQSVIPRPPLSRALERTRKKKNWNFLNCHLAAVFFILRNTAVGTTYGEPVLHRPAQAQRPSRTGQSITETAIGTCHSTADCMISHRFPTIMNLIQSRSSNLLQKLRTWHMPVVAGICASCHNKVRPQSGWSILGKDPSRTSNEDDSTTIYNTRWRYPHLRSTIGHWPY